MFFCCDLAPNSRVNLREEGVRIIETMVDMGDIEFVGYGHKLAIDHASADNESLFFRRHSGLGLRDGIDGFATLELLTLYVSENDVATIRQRMLGQREPGSLSHDDGASGGNLFEMLEVGGIELNNTTKAVTVDGKAVNLTPTEFDILKLLMEYPGKVFSPKEIYRKVWGEDAMSAGENTVAVHIRHLREKIEITPNEPRYIKVIFGQGYKIEKGRN